MAKTFAVSLPKVENFEDILQRVGGFGKFQFVILVLLLSLEIPAAFVAFSPVFFGAKPSVWLCDNKTVLDSEICQCNGTLSSEFSSVVSEWNLICNSAWVSDFLTSLQMLGMFFGNIYAAQISDWYGRKYTFLGTALLMTFGTAVSAVSPNPYVFGFARVLCGSGFSGFMGLTVIYAMEFMTPRWRPICGSVGPFGEGIMILGGLAYFFRPWRSLLWATVVPFVFLVIIFPFVPESPRWLLRNQKLSEGQKVLNFIARLNGQKEIDFEVVKQIAEQEKQEGSTKIEKMSFLKFFQDKDTRRTSLCLMTIWGCWAIMYFGISYNIKNLGGNIYLNVVFMGLADAIGYPVAFFANSKMGRCRALAGFMSLTACFLVSLAILLLVFDMTENPIVVVTLCLLGKSAAASARSSLRCLTGESYPTSIRTMGMGLVGISASISGLLAPQLAFLGSRWPSVPFFAFAVFSTIGALVSFLLTETKGKPLQTEIGNNNNNKVENPSVRRRVSINSILPSPKTEMI